MTPQEQVQVAAVLTGVLRSAEKLSGRIRFQKLAYLLQQKGVPELGDVEFVYHHYGPYSEEVAEVLSKAVRTGIFTEKAESFDDEWQRYEYSLSRDADHYVGLLSLESKRIIQSVVALTDGLHWRVLELAATALFLQKRDNGTIDAAVAHALSLKPGCRGHERSAIDLLQKLESMN